MSAKGSATGTVSSHNFCFSLPPVTNTFVVTNATAVLHKGATPPYNAPWLQGWTRWIAPQTIQLGELGPVGSDGFLYQVLPDNETLDFTPRVKNEEFYHFGINQQKHKLRLAANGQVLEPDKVVAGAEFCVGQKVTFTAQWDPALVGVSSNAYDWVMSTKYVNHSWQHCRYDEFGNAIYYGSVNYDRDAEVLKLAAPWAWWVTGGDKNVKLDLTVHFDNGQSATVPAWGRFRMLRPRVTRCEARGPFAAGIDRSDFWPSLSLMNGPMVFEVYISKTYPGKFGITQLVNMFSQTMIQLPPYFIWHSTLGTFWLDGVQEFYDGEKEVELSSWPSDGEFSEPTLIYDMPGQALCYVMGSYNGDWQDYVRFTPAGNNSIAVTLARIEWHWAATAELSSGGWAITSDGVDGPVLYEDDGFPEWTEVRPAPKDSP
ncbi:MAG TPA: hypothetical protein P5233_13910 [Candidatus Paceibacterota bacterium]|nr:hypothetical protein [Candidatus Paceibacterota bacterium]